MRHALQLSLGIALATSGALAAQTVPQIGFQTDANALRLPPDTYFGEVAGVATNSSGHVYVHTRTGVPIATLGTERTFFHGSGRLFEFDQNGTFLREIGQDTYSMDYPQQVRVDAQDNVWVVDAGSNTVIKFDRNGRFLLVLGRKPESIAARPGAGLPARSIDAEYLAARAAAAGGGGGRGAGGGGGRGGAAAGAGQLSHNFSRPADVGVDRAGNIYVADGFGTNNRIAKFSPDGNIVASWGQTGSESGQFNGIRGIAIDRADNVYVADAGNRRIQVFDTQGRFRSQITGIGTPQAICISAGATQYLFSSNSNGPESMENGEIYKLQLDGRIVGRFGRAGRIPGEFGMVNAIDCRSDRELWVGEVWNWRVQKVTLDR